MACEVMLEGDPRYSGSATPTPCRNKTMTPIENQAGVIIARQCGAGHVTPISPTEKRKRFCTKCGSRTQDEHGTGCSRAIGEADTAIEDATDWILGDAAPAIERDRSYKSYTPAEIAALYPATEPTDAELEEAAAWLEGALLLGVQAMGGPLTPKEKKTLWKPTE